MTEKLKTLRQIRASIGALEKKIRKLREETENITRRLENSQVQSTHMNDVLAGQIALIVDWTRELDEKKCELMLLEADMERMFRSLPSLQYNVMTCHYVYGMSYAKIGKEYHYEPDYLRHVAKKARSKLQEDTKSHIEV